MIAPPMIAPRRIAMVQGAPGPVIQRLFADCVNQWTPSIRVAGVIEEPRIDATSPQAGTAQTSSDATSQAGHLRCIGDDRRFPLFQTLGSGATGCSLDPAGAVLAGEAVRQRIAQGCDLVLLSKFGKMEAESGSGLMAAFIAAVEGGIPVLTSVAPRYEESWSRFADPLFLRLPADRLAIERWWQTVSPAA